jgi:hypothetical protein
VSDSLKSAKVTNVHWPVFQIQLDLASVSVLSLDVDHQDGGEPLFKWKLEVAKGFGCWPKEAYIVALKGKNALVSVPVPLQGTSLPGVINLDFTAPTGFFSKVEELAAFEFM